GFQALSSPACLFSSLDPASALCLLHPLLVSTFLQVILSQQGRAGGRAGGRVVFLPLAVISFLSFFLSFFSAGRQQQQQQTLLFLNSTQLSCFTLQQEAALVW
ncbi:MAG: hypothetical protein LGB70_07605, partial [Sulfurovum sp.]|nr:hypothetical protein [Sulfurovum sp.]